MFGACGTPAPSASPSASPSTSRPPSASPSASRPPSASPPPAGGRDAYTTIQAESFNQQLGQVIQAQLKSVGMDAQVKAYDRGTYFNKLFGGTDSWIFFYLWPVPMDVVTLFINSAAADGKGPNWSNAKLPSIDAGIAKYQKARNQSQWNAASAALQVDIAKNLPLIPIVNRQAFFVNRKNVHGYLPHQWNLYPYYNDVWLS